jgi:hypothetical protein
MKQGPLDIALRHIAETKGILGQLIISSESFDYLKAKEALGQLERKMKDLGKAQAELELLNRPSHPNIVSVPRRQRSLDC